MRLETLTKMKLVIHLKGEETKKKKTMREINKFPFKTFIADFLKKQQIVECKQFNSSYTSIINI